MAQIDPSIAMGFRPIQIESPVNQMAAIAQLRNLQETSQMNALKMRELQRGEETRNKLSRIHGTPGLEIGSPAYMERIAQEVPDYYETAVDRQLKREQLRESKQTADLKQLDQDLVEFNRVYNPALIRTVDQAKARTKALYAHPTLGKRAARLMPEADALARTEIEFTTNYPGYVAVQSELSADKLIEAENKRFEQDYADHIVDAVERGEKPLSRAEFSKSQMQPAPVAAPVTDAAATGQDDVGLSQADFEAERLRRRRNRQATPAPAAAVTTTATATATPPETSTPDMSPKAAAYIRSGNPTLIKLGEEIQKKFLKDVEANRPTYSEINLGDKVAVVKRNPATGKTTIVDSFPINISPADKQRLINDSIRIKQDNRRIQLDAQRVDLQTKRDALEAQKAARDADPAFQERMAAARAKGTETTKNQIKAQQILPSVISRGEEGIRLIDDLIGKAPVKDKNGKIIEEGTKPHPGFETAVGATWLPGSRFVPGTSAADFQARYEQLKGASFLEAFETLKGGGQITEKEGAQATAAINRMALAQSEAEFIAAAREVQNILDRGIKNAKTRAKVASAEQSSTRSEANAILGIP